MTVQPKESDRASAKRRNKMVGVARGRRTSPRGVVQPPTDEDHGDWTRHADTNYKTAHTGDRGLTDAPGPKTSWVETARRLPETVKSGTQPHRSVKLIPHVGRAPRESFASEKRRKGFRGPNCRTTQTQGKSHRSRLGGLQL